MAERLTTSTSPSLLTGLLYSYSRIDRSDDVARLFVDLKKMEAQGPVGAGTWALAHLAVGDSEQALHWLSAAIDKIENREPDAGALNLLTIKTNIHENPVLEEPRFRALRDKIGVLTLRR